MAKRRRVQPQQIKTSLTAAHAPPAGISDYRHFLDTYIAGAGFGKAKQSVAAAKVRGWQDVPAGDQGDIINEIAKKFNSSNALGIPKASHTAGGPESSTYYWSDKGKPNLTLRPRVNLLDGPNPVVLGHELMHANDHQSKLPVDQLNPRGWNDLRQLAITGGAANGSMNDLNQFNDSLGNIQDKLDQSEDFKKYYPIDEDYIKANMKAAAKVGAAGNPAYTIPLSGGAGSAPNWPQLFNDINDVVTYPSAIAGAPPNKGFFLNRASEFPAFMAENLTKPWAVNAGVNPLSIQEARFLHSTLGNMEAAYPGAEYPTMNKYIGQRRNSIADAYYPPQQGGVSGSGVPGAGFSRGGRITGKNLLSRFKKTH